MLLFTLFAAFLPATLAVKCYVCSWSPKDAPNKTAMCNDEQFEANGLAISPECENGCQTYMHMDRNGVVEQIRRSCLQADEPMTGKCLTEETKAFTLKRCTCNYNLCNSASALTAKTLLVVAFSIFMLRIRNFI